MGSRICDHLRGNVVGYIAIFLFATGGTAIALDGSNTVFSDDIVNGEVTSPDVLNQALTASDLGPASVGSSEVAQASVGSPKVANNSLSAADLGPDSVGSSEVANNSLSAADLGTNSVGADEIDTGAVGSGEIAYQNPEWALVDRNTIGSPVAALRAGPFSGPVQPPFGVGSLGLTVGADEKASFGNEVDFLRDDVSALTEVGYRVFTTPENISAAPPGTPNMPSITFEIDPNGAGGTTTNFSSLTWSPAQNSGPNLWSAYIDATSAGFWGLTGSQFNSPATAANCGLDGPRCSFNEVQAFLASGTGAKIGTAAVNKGTDTWPFSGAVDGLRINDIVYDFEPFGTVETAP